MDAKTGYIPNQIPLSVFFSKPGGSMDWSLASHKSMFSLHTGNVSLSREHRVIGLGAALKLEETQKSSDDESKVKEHKTLVVSGKQDEEKEEAEDDDEEEKIKPEESNEPVKKTTETNTFLSLPLVNESLHAESDNEDDDSKIEEMTKLNSKEYDMSNVASKHEDKETVKDDDGYDLKEQSNVTCEQEEKEEIEDDVIGIILDDSSICCRSDTSNNSISSFTFPILHNENGSVKTPSMELRWNVFDKRLELSQPHPQTQFYFIPATHTLTQLPPQRKSSSLSKQAPEMQSQKAYWNRWLSCSCFYCPSQRD